MHMQYSAVAGSYLQYSMACGVEGTQTRSIVLALTILMLLRAGYLAEGMNHTVHRKVKQYRRQREDESAGVPTNGTDMELVIARYSEPDINWLKDVPEFYRVTVYNKGGTEYAMPEPPEGRFWNVVILPNLGREANAFAEHLVRRYDSLAAYTIFSQADPFVHNKHYLKLLQNPTLLGPVQTMSIVYKTVGNPGNITPESVVEKMSKHPWYRTERASLRTLNSLWYHDGGSVVIQQDYLEQHQLERGTNLIHYHFGLIGLPDWVPVEQEVGSFAFGGLVGFERSKAMQHPKKCYELLLQTTYGHHSNAWMIERMWVMMFGGPDFRD